MKKVAIVGSGQMGSGIAQVLATTGTEVAVYDVSSEQLERAKTVISKSLNKLSEKGKISAKPDEILGRLQFTTSIDQLSASQLAIEAATEKLEVKQKIFEQLDSILPADSIIASNTSSISITKLAAFTRRPDKFMGVHFMNPVPIMKLVELISGTLTSAETVQKMEALVESLGKIKIHSQDYAGFIVNRILMPMINEACYALYEGIGTKEDIDTGMKLGTNHPMGPLELADFIGLDTCLSILEVLHEGLGDPKYRACPILKNHVAAGLLGRKTGRGFYTYEKG